MFRTSQDPTRIRPDHKHLKQVIIQDLDTSVSDTCYQSDKANQNEKDSSDSTNPGRSQQETFFKVSCINI
ncbi:hypothetical protein NQ314_009891 [Rhamnusium bicolor]|uniref:Uncharacterized protein n=1 Tax=Rhamnusium bicolor TaxID=1586634 RepID=A0AAV8XVI3_9CUCU|nr:hypothetical protein NQ314_009891 [Rhamnusium bicolor]